MTLTIYPVIMIYLVILFVILFILLPRSYEKEGKKKKVFHLRIVLVFLIICTVIIGSYLQLTVPESPPTVYFFLNQEDSDIKENANFSLIFKNKTYAFIERDEIEFEIKNDKWYDFEIQTKDYMFIGSNYSASGAIYFQSDNGRLKLKINNEQNCTIQSFYEIDHTNKFVVRMYGEEGFIVFTISASRIIY